MANCFITLIAAMTVFAQSTGLAEQLPLGSVVARRDSLWKMEISSHPDDAQVRQRYARFLLSTGLTEQALNQFQEAAKLDAKDPEPLIELAEIYAQNLDYDRALGYAEAALGLQPSSSAARAVLIRALLQRDTVDQAAKQLKTLLAANPHSAQALQLAYQVKTKQGNFSEAERYLQQAVSLRPAHSEWVLQLVDLLENEGKWEAAYAHLDNLVTRTPSSIEARLRLARNLEFYRHNFDTAIFQYERVLEVDGKNPAALAGIERCRAKKNNLALMLKQAIRSLFFKAVPRNSIN